MKKDKLRDFISLSIVKFCINVNLRKMGINGNVVEILFGNWLRIIGFLKAGNSFQVPRHLRERFYVRTTEKECKGSCFAKNRIKPCDRLLQEMENRWKNKPGALKPHLKHVLMQRMLAVG